jgi:hypothetical protein
MSDIIPQPCVLTQIDRNPTHAQLQLLKQRMIEMGGDLHGPEPQHFFADGVYGRKLVIPANILLLGKVQRKANITVQLYGDIEVTTDDGPKRLVGQHVFRAPPMTERVGWTHAETAWMTFHATDQTDILMVEQELIVPESAMIEGDRP